MKKIIYILTLTLGFVFLHSCVNDEDDIFGELSVVRVNNLIKECDKVLTSVPNGWLMEYYAGGTSSKMGGYSFIFTFKEGKVSVMSELTPDEEVTSLYRYNASQSAVLTFDTYNKLFHLFSEPQESVTTYRGDYEFVIMDVAPEKVVLKGRKYGNTIIMTPFPDNTDKKAYLETVAEIAQANNYPYFDVYINGAEIVKAGYSYTRQFTFTPNSTLFRDSISENVLFTPTGISFYEPITLNGITVQNFEWNENSLEYVCTDGVDVVFKASELPENYLFFEEFEGSYQAVYEEPGYLWGQTIIKNVRLTKSPSLLDREYILSNLVTGDNVKLKYDMARGTLVISYYFDILYSGNESLYAQHVLPLADGKDGFLYYIQNEALGGYEGRWNGDRSNFKIEFSDNGINRNEIIGFVSGRQYPGTTELADDVAVTQLVMTRR